MDEQKTDRSNGKPLEMEKKPSGKEGAAGTEPEEVRSSPVVERLREEMPDAVEEAVFDRGDPIVRVPGEHIEAVCRFLKEDPGCRMTLLTNLSGVDMSGLGRPDPRFDVVYHLYSVETGERLAVKVAVAEGSETPSLTSVWKTANWHEREAYDMFGIVFSGHPDLRRILMPESFDAFPLRKDFPLEGREKDHGYWRKPEDDERYRYAPIDRES